MNITFNSSHMKTLIKLQDIAAKHDAIIRMGMNSNASSAEDPSIIFDYVNFSEKTRRLIEDKDFDFIENIAISATDCIWFSLKEKEKNHELAYITSEIGINLSYMSDFIDDIEDENIQDEIEEEITYEEINNNWMHRSDSKTRIYGFGHKNNIEDHRVYRPGMALKFFSDLVCDYLGEPRIIETY